MYFLGVNDDGRYHVLNPDQIIDVLLLHCWPYETRFGNRTAAVRQAELALERWLALGLPCRREGGKRWFDLCQVLNFMRWAAAEHGDPIFPECSVLCGRRQSLELAPPGWRTTHASTAHAPRPMAISLRREFNLQGRPPGASLRLRVPTPYEDRTQSQVTVDLVEPVGAVRQSTAPGRLELRLPMPDDGSTVAVEVRIAWTASCEAHEVDPACLEDWDRSDPEYELYTRRSEGPIRVTATIARLAESLAGTARNPWEAINAFWDFFFERMNLGYIHHDEPDPVDPLGSLLQRGWFDCLWGSALLIALCRARGIPARIVNGFHVMSVIHANHYWMEILLPPYGWVPFDLLSWNLAGGKCAESWWSRYYFGRMDYRMKVQCFPHLIIGNTGVRFPSAWYLTTALTAEGCATSYHALETGQLLYRDEIRVCRPAAEERSIHADTGS